MKKTHFSQERRKSLLAALRCYLGLTQAQLANRVGKSQSWMSKVESGWLQPRSKDARRLAQLFGYEEAALFETAAEKSEAMGLAQRPSRDREEK